MHNMCSKINLYMTAHRLVKNEEICRGRRRKRRTKENMVGQFVQAFLTTQLESGNRRNLF